MENVSIGLDQDLMVDRLISNVRVKRKGSGFATHTYKQKHGISADLLARKWGIVIDKAKQTLQSTTKDNLRSALKPLTQWYRKRLLSQRLHILKCIFYTDTLFSKDKSTVGNTCAHIF